MRITKTWISRTRDKKGKIKKQKLQKYVSFDFKNQDIGNTEI